MQLPQDRLLSAGDRSLKVKLYCRDKDLLFSRHILSTDFGSELRLAQQRAFFSNPKRRPYTLA
jgi:hypothetical protein